MNDAIPAGDSAILGLNWAAAIAAATEHTCHAYADVFRKESDKALGIGAGDAGERWRILYKACFLHFRSENADEPFGPMMVVGGRRSPIPEDFSSAELDSIEHLTLAVDDAELKSRLADIIWIRRRKANFARVAVEAYIQSAERLIDPERWVEGFERIERATRIARQLGRDGDQIASAIAFIETTLRRHNAEDPLFLTIKLLSLCNELGLSDPKQLYAIALHGAEVSAGQQDWNRQREYLELAAEFARANKDNDGKLAAKIGAAETYVREADDALSNPGQGHIIASHHLALALEAYRRLGTHKQRERELYAKLTAAQRQSISSFQVIQSDPIDLTKMVDAATSAVSGRSFVNSIVALTALSRFADISKEFAGARDRAQEFVLSRLFPATVVDHEGKVIARKPAAGLEEGDESEEALRHDVLQSLSLRRSLTVAGAIVPALQQITREHPRTQDRWMPIVRNNPFIPSGREGLFARAFDAGLSEDWVIAAHIILLQFENSLRHLLKVGGLPSSKMRSDGTQEERTLDELLSLPEIEHILSPDVVFEVKSILTEKSSANLRHRLAHGMIGHSGFFAPDVVYLWWLVLKLCCAPFAAAIAAASENSDRNNVEENAEVIPDEVLKSSSTNGDEE